MTPARSLTSQPLFGGAFFGTKDTAVDAPNPPAAPGLRTHRATRRSSIMVPWKLLIADTLIADFRLIWY
jgi:hypothetical protein